MLRRRPTTRTLPLALAPQEAPAADVCIIGLGYVGLPLAALLADKALRIAGCDIRGEVVEAVNEGRITIVEPQLDELVSRVAANGKLRAHTAPQPAHAFIIAVPTPTDADHKADMTAVFNAVRSIAPVLKPGNLVVIESTSPGRNHRCGRRIAGAAAQRSYFSAADARPLRTYSWPIVPNACSPARRCGN